MPAVLVLFAHPALEKSRVNARLAEAARGVAGITFHDLYEAYPDFQIDVAAEQARLAAHDVIVWQHPFYWYSVPALLKEWTDLVLAHGWAYGSQGRALAGKLAVSVCTAGGPESAYGAEGFNRYTVRQLLAPVEQTWRLCRVDWLGPWVVHGTHRMEPAAIAAAAQDYARLLAALRDGRLDLDRARTAPRLSASLLPAD